MLKHSRSEIPSEITGILLGRFVDDYSIKVSDVFGTPQKGDIFEEKKVQNEKTFQERMIENLLKTNQKDDIIGWYSSHPGKGLWLSAVAVNKQMNRAKTEPRSFAMVVDPIQSVKGQPSIGAFRCYNLILASHGEEPREITSFEGNLEKPTTKQLVRGLNKQYYQLPVTYRMDPTEEPILESLHKGLWESPLNTPTSFQKNDRKALRSIKKLIKNASIYKQQILEEEGMSYEDRMKRNIGKIDPCNFIKEETDKITIAQIKQLFIIEVNSITF